MSNVAASVRKQKEKNPELFCAVPKCLWRIKTSRGDSPCRNHPITPTPTPAPSSTMVNASDLRCGDTIRTEDGSEDRILSLMGRYMALASGRVILLDGQSVALVSRVPHADDSLWNTGGRYCASASDAEAWRKIEAAQAKRMAERFAAVIARMADAPGMEHAAD